MNFVVLILNLIEVFIVLIPTLQNTNLNANANTNLNMNLVSYKNNLRSSNLNTNSNQNSNSAMLQITNSLKAKSATQNTNKSKSSIKASIFESFTKYHTKKANFLASKLVLQGQNLNKVKKSLIPMEKPNQPDQFDPLNPPPNGFIPIDSPNSPPNESNEESDNNRQIAVSPTADISDSTQNDKLTKDSAINKETNIRDIALELNRDKFSIENLNIGKGPIFYKGWIKYFKYRLNTEENPKKPTAFYKNFFYDKQFKVNPKLNLEEKDEKGDYVNIRNQLSFYFILYKDSLNIISDKKVSNHIILC